MEALYSTRVGTYQVVVLQLKLRIRALRRKIELTRSYIVRMLPLDMAQIELTVIEELAEAELQIMEQLLMIENGKDLLSNLSSPKRSAELREIFRDLAFRLHPDVNPELSSEQKNLWHMVKDAYQTGDLNKLKALKVVYENELSDSADSVNSLTDSQLELKTEVLKEGIKSLNEQIKAIRSGFPFDIEEQIKDEEWVQQRQEAIQAERLELEKYETRLEQELEALINGYGGSQPN